MFRALTPPPAKKPGSVTLRVEGLEDRTTPTSAAGVWEGALEQPGGPWTDYTLSYDLEQTGTTLRGTQRIAVAGQPQFFGVRAVSGAVAEGRVTLTDGGITSQNLPPGYTWLTKTVTMPLPSGVPSETVVGSWSGLFYSGTVRMRHVSAPTPPPPPDLRALSAATTPAGVQFRYSTDGRSPPVTAAVYLSADARFDPTDVPVAATTVTPPPNSSAVGEVRFRGFTPTAQRPYMLLVLDPQNAVRETNEGNNVALVRQGPLAWGARVSGEFAAKVQAIGRTLRVNPDFLMAVMAFETGETFSPSVRNAAGSGAVGLIQFMPDTARGLGTSTTALARMTAEEQLDYVERYFARFAGRLNTLEDTYMAVLYPVAVGKPSGFALFRRGTIAYTQNAGLDADNNGVITKAEAAAQVRLKLAKGLRPGYVG